MKKYYWGFLGITLMIVGGIAAMIIIVFPLHYGEFPLQTESSAIIASAFATLALAVIAIFVANKPPRFAKFAVEVKKLNHKSSEDSDKFDNAPDEVQKEYRNIVGKHFYTYQVHFAIRSQSKFTLEKPTVSLWYSKDFAFSFEYKGIWVFNCRSDVYGRKEWRDSRDFRHFEWEKFVLVEKIPVPELNFGESFDMWIRMRLSKDDKEYRYIKFNLNCDNAEGTTEKVKIIPSELLKEIEGEGEIK